MATDPAQWADRLAVAEGDITRFPADVIVNAASHTLLGYSGLSGAVFGAAGPGLRDECAGLNGCPEGDARITAAHGLPARHIVHAVGPVWRAGYDGLDEALARCYRRCFELIRGCGARTVAFPSIGTGAHGFPVQRASQIAVREMRRALCESPGLEKVTVVCYDPATYASYLEARRELLAESHG